MCKPNILFLMPDQLRPDFLSCYGASFIETPHIDSLAAEGVRYDKAYSLQEDPTEQRNLLKEQGYGEVYLRLDQALTTEIMRSTVASHHDKIVYKQDLSSDADFGKSGWQRAYPKSL